MHAGRRQVQAKAIRATLGAVMHGDTREAPKGVTRQCAEVPCQPVAAGTATGATRYTLARSMKYEREQLGDGFSVPCARLCLAANGRPSVARGLAAQIFRLVDTEGALLIRGTGLRSPHEFAAFLEAIEFQPHSYVGGTTPRTEYAAGVYTATDLPPDRRILLHQEMAYLDDVPDYVVFYCQEPPEHGQKTNLIGDMRAFTEKLPESFKRRFRGKRARLRRRLPAAGGSNGAYTDRKSWQESLGTDDRREAERIGRQRGWELAWTDDDCLEIMQEPARFFRSHPIHGELWCTQAMVFQPESSRLIAERDGSTADTERLASTMANRMIMEDGTLISVEECRTWFKLVCDLETPYALGRGEVIILDNMLTAHGRSTFTGSRRLFAALGDRPGTAHATAGVNGR